MLYRSHSLLKKLIYKYIFEVYCTAKMESSTTIETNKRALIDSFSVPPNLLKTLVTGNERRSHGAVVLYKALLDPSSRFLLTIDMESGGENERLYNEIGIGHKVFQVGIALTLWSKTRSVIALFSAAAYNPQKDDKDMNPKTLKWYYADERAKINLSKLKQATDITHNEDSDQARKDMADGARAFFYGWQRFLLERVPKTAMIRICSDHPCHDPHLFSNFLKVYCNKELAPPPELPMMLVKNKETRTIDYGYRFIHDVHTLQYAAALVLNERLRQIGCYDPNMSDWSGLGTWLNDRVCFPSRTIGAADDKEKHNASIDAATMAFDYMDCHDILENNYELKKTFFWRQ